jgi:hypothetical protein
LAGSAIGTWALRNNENQAIFKSRPSPRVCMGLALIIASYLIGPLGLALCVNLALEQGWTLPLTIIGGGLVVLVHLVFALGVYLSGANYAKALLRWGIAKFIRRYM